jgi:hypothetical protein
MPIVWLKKRAPTASAIALALALLIGAPPTASAQAAEGVVLSVDAQNVVVDIGTTRGADNGDFVEVWRPIKMKHPVTGAVILDRFKIGRIKITQARPAMSIGKIDGDFERPLAVGDVVILPKTAAAVPPPPPVPAKATVPAPTPAGKQPAPREVAPPPLPESPTTVTTTTTTTKTSTPPAPTAPAPTTLPKADPDAKDLDDLFRSLKGATPEARLTAYEKWVLEHPQSRHVEVIWSEARALKKLIDHEREVALRIADSPRTISFDPPKEAPAGVPLRVTMELAKTRGATLHVRRQGTPGFVSQPMKEEGPGYFTGTIDVDLMKEGTLEYFVESTSARGETHEIAGTAASPMTVKVEDTVPPDTRARPKPGPLVIASALTDYASFNAKKSNDMMWQSEAQLGVRLGDEGLRAFRSGFGVYRGKGGTLEDLEEKGLEGRKVGLTYGYLETELAFLQNLSFIGRGIIGLREDGVTGGAQGFIRIGNDRRTNIMVGGEILGGIGLRGITQIEWSLHPRVPVTLRSEVTNQPAGVARAGSGPTASAGQGEVGVRSIVQVGYRLTPHLVVAGRGSFQARTINHAGPGGGAAVIYEW